MTGARPVGRGSVLDTVHYDIGILATRVSGNDAAIATLSNQLANVAKDMAGSIDNLAAKMDRQQAEYAAGKGTNWYGFIGAATAILVVLGSFLSVAKNPIDVDLSRHELAIAKIGETAVRKEDFRDFRDVTNAWLASLRDRQAALAVDTVSQRQLAEFKDRLDKRDDAEQSVFSAFVARADKTTDAISAQLVKRPEIEAAAKTQDERITALSARMNDMQKSMTDLLAAQAVAVRIAR